MNRNGILLAFVIAFGAFSVRAQNVFGDYQDGRIWFKLKDSYQNDAYLSLPHGNIDLSIFDFLHNVSDKYGVVNLSRPFFTAEKDDPLSRTFLIKFDLAGLVMDFISDIEASGQVEYAERVPFDKPCVTPNDPSYSSQWHLPKIKADKAWNYFSSGSAVVLAIVDDAIKATHPDLSPNLWVNPGEIAGNGVDDDGNGYIDDVNGFDVASFDNNPNPPSSAYDHGSHVAGIACAATNNSSGVSSVGYSVKLMCVKASDNGTSIAYGYDGIFYAASNGADIINMSWGSNGTSSTAQNVINYAHNKGCVLVAGSGNNSSSIMFYPAAYTDVIAVASTDNTDKKASSSNYGSWLDISAPGVSIYSTTYNNSYGYKSGTSMASPLVAGLCGLMKSYDTTLTSTQIRNCLLSSVADISAQNPGFSGFLGSGRINAEAAMMCIDSLQITAGLDEEGASKEVLKVGYTPFVKDLALFIGSEEAGTVRIYNSLGMLVERVDLPKSSGTKTFDYNFGTKPTGVYILEWNEPGIHIAKKIMVY